MWQSTRVHLGLGQGGWIQGLTPFHPNLSVQLNVFCSSFGRRDLWQHGNNLEYEHFIFTTYFCTFFANSLELLYGSVLMSRLTHSGSWGSVPRIFNFFSCVILVIPQVGRLRTQAIWAAVLLLIFSPGFMVCLMLNPWNPLKWDRIVSLALAHLKLVVLGPFGRIGKGIFWSSVAHCWRWEGAVVCILHPLVLWVLLSGWGYVWFVNTYALEAFSPQPQGRWTVPLPDISLAFLCGPLKRFGV